MNEINISVFTDEGFFKKIVLFNGKKEMKYYSYDSKGLLIKKYKKEWIRTGVFDVFSKLIDNKVVTIETKWQKLKPIKEFPTLSIPYISGYVFDDGIKRIVQSFNEKFFAENRLLYLSSYNASFVSFVSEKKSIVVIPIEKN